MRGLAPEPLSQKCEVFAPVAKCCLFEDASAFPYSSMIKAQNLNLPGSQVASPADPRDVRIMSFRCERAYKQNSRDWSFYAMKYRIKMSSGNSEISGLFYQSFIPTVEVALAIARAVVQASFSGKRPL
jgi:hypothetical protein